jgi:hypothetical protein
MTGIILHYVWPDGMHRSVVRNSITEEHSSLCAQNRAIEYQAEALYLNPQVHILFF